MMVIIIILIVIVVLIVTIKITFNFLTDSRLALIIGKMFINEKIIVHCDLLRIRNLFCMQIIITWYWWCCCVLPIFSWSLRGVPTDRPTGYADNLSLHISSKGNLVLMSSSDSVCYLPQKVSTLVGAKRQICP